MNESLISLVFDDDLVENVVKKNRKKGESAVIFDFSPSVGRISIINPLIRFRLITELSLIGHNIEDISNISILANLTKLNLSWNSITSIVPLMKLTRLEILHLGHNQIETIPKSISSLSNLRNLQISFNPISDRGVFLAMKQNLNLTCFDFESTTISCEPDSIIFSIYILPQLTVVNRMRIEPKMRRDASRRFGRSEIKELSESNFLLVDENRKYKKMIGIMREQLDNPDYINEVNKLRNEKTKLIEFIKKQDQVIEHLQNSKNEKDDDNPLSTVVKDLQEKVHLLNDQLAQKNKENKILSYQIQDIETAQKNFDELKNKNIQYQEKLNKLMQDNQLLQSTNCKLYDQIGEMKQEPIRSAPPQQDIDELIKQNNELKNSIEKIQNERSQLIAQLGTDLKNRDATIKSLQGCLTERNNEISELKLTIANLSSTQAELENTKIERENYKIEQDSKSKSLFEALSIEIENQRQYYSLNLNKPIANSSEEESYLLCTQAFKQIQIQYDNMKQKIDSSKSKKLELLKTIEALQDEQKSNNDLIKSLKSNADSLSKEISLSKDKLNNTVPKSDYIQVKNELEKVKSENEKNGITLKRVVSQLSQQKRAKNDILQTKSATDEENEELMKRIETLSNELKQKRDKAEELRFETSKHERKVLRLKEIINKMTIEKNQLTVQIEQFNIFRDEVSETIAKLEHQQSAKESKLRERINSCEAEKTALQLKVQQFSSKINELNQANISMFDVQKEFDSKIKLKERDILDLETSNENLRNQLRQANEAFAAQKEEDKDIVNSLQNQINLLQNQLSKDNITKETEKKQIQSLLDESINREKKLQKKSARYKEFIERIQSDSQKIREENDKLKLDIENYIEKAKESNEKEIRSKEMANTNEHLFKTLTQKYQDLQRQFNEISNICNGNEEEQMKLKMIIKQLKEQCKDFQQEIQQTSEEKQELDTQLLAKNQVITNLKAQLDEANSKINDNGDNTSKLRQQNLDLQNQITESLIENDNLKRKIVNLEKTTVSNDVYQSIVDKSKDIGEKFEELNLINNENVNTIEKLNSEKAALGTTITNLQKKYYETMSQLKNTEDLNAKTNQIQQKTIESLKQQLSDAKQLIDQKNNQENLSEKQKENEISQIKAELTQIKTNLALAKEDLNIKIKDYNQLKEENTTLKQSLDETQQKLNETEIQLSDYLQKFKNEKNQHEEDNDEKLRQISQTKKQLREFEKTSQSLQEQINDLTKQNKEKVPVKKFEKLQQKYQSLKKLHEFETSKTKSSIIQRDEQIENLTNEFAEKEELLNEKIEKISKDNEDKKELIKRLQKQIQIDNKKIEELLPLKPAKEELSKCQKELQARLNEISQLNEKCEALSANCQKSNSIMNESQVKSEKIASNLAQIPLIFSTTGTNTAKLEAIAKKLNPILRLYSISEVSTSFARKNKLIFGVNADISPSNETLLEKHRNLLKRVTQLLMSLPIGKPGIDIESNDQLENQLQKLQTLVQLVKKIFDEREKNIEDLAKMVDSQHQAVLKISEVPTDSSSVAVSFHNYQSSQQIIREDRSRRSVMMNSSLTPRKY